MLPLLDLNTFHTVDRTRLEAQIRGATGYAALSPEVGLARVLGRYKMYVAPDDDAISAHFILDGFWEMWNTQFLAKFVRPGWTVVEVGAHLGYFSLLLSDIAGPTGRLVGFEPVSRNAGLLRRSLAVNGFLDRYTIEQKAVSDTDRRGRIHVPRGNWGGGSLLLGASPDMVSAEDIEVVSLDRYCTDKGVRPDFIRMDAEGAEQSIWKGMKNIISSSKKLAVMFEFDTLRAPNWRDWFREIESMGFKTYRIGSDAKPHRMGPDTAPPEGVCDMLALKGYVGAFGD